MPLGILKAQHKAKDMKPIAKILHLVIVAATTSCQANSHNKRCQQRRQRRMVPSKKLFFHTFLVYINNRYYHTQAADMQRPLLIGLQQLCRTLRSDEQPVGATLHSLLCFGAGCLEIEMHFPRIIRIVIIYKAKCP